MRYADDFIVGFERAGIPSTLKNHRYLCLERLVESQQGSGLQDDRELRDSACRNEQ
jgi:hypothetical protein